MKDFLSSLFKDKKIVTVTVLSLFVIGFSLYFPGNFAQKVSGASKSVGSGSAGHGDPGDAQIGTVDCNTMNRSGSIGNCDGDDSSGSGSNNTPAITLNGASTVSVTVGGTYTELGATAYDSEDGNLTVPTPTGGPVSTASVRTYVLTYSVTDSGGLSASINRTVNIVSGDPDPEDPGDGNGNGIGAQLCGFAWGATDESPTPLMGAGWVSFNSKDCDLNGNGIFDDGVNGCPSGGQVKSYSVAVDPSSNQLNGYAWSSNLGWVKFSGLSSFPNTSYGSNAAIVGSGENKTVNGWARFCAGTASGDCSSMTSRIDGWDGWLSLQGSNYGVTFASSTQLFSGYSWSGPVAGWLKWDLSSGKGVRYCASTAQTLTSTLSANPTSGPASLNTVLTAGYTLTPSGGSVSYRFKCDYAGNWSSSQSGSTYNCSYGQAGTYYHPQVEVTSGSLTSTASAEVHTDSAALADLGLSCSVTHPAFLGELISWKATINNPSGHAPYAYTFDFTDGQPDVDISDGETATVQRTYTTLGQKSLSVHVIDNALSAEATCNATTTVVVKPKIIEQ